MADQSRNLHMNIPKWADAISSTRIRTYAVFGLAFLCILFTIAVYYPGLMSFDSVWQLREAREGVFDNHQPPMMSYVWRVLDHIIPGPAGMLLMDVCLYWLGIAWIVRLTVSSNLVRLPLVLLLGFWPPLFGLAGTIWKDVGMNSFLVMFVACLLLAQIRRRLRYLAWSNLLLFLAASFRPNAVPACVPLVAVSVWITRDILLERWPHVESALRRMRLWLFSVAAAFGANLAILTLAVTFVNSYGVKDANAWAFTAIHDLVGISVYEDHNLLPDAVTKANQLTMDDLRGMYVGDSIATLFNPSSRRLLGSADPNSTKVIGQHGDPKTLSRTWVIAILDHPGAYLWHRAHVAEKLLVFEAGKPWYPFHIGIENNPWGLIYVQSPLNRKVTAGLHFAADSTYLYSAWIYHIVLLVFAGVTPLLPLRNRWLISAIALSGLLYSLINFLFAPAADFRYDIWAVTSALLCCTLLLAGFDRGAGGSGVDVDRESIRKVGHQLPEPAAPDGN